MTKPNLNSQINKAFINDTSSINQFHLLKIDPSYRSQEQSFNNVECLLKRKEQENNFNMNMPCHKGNDKNLLCPAGPIQYASLLCGHSRQHTNEQLFNREFFEKHFELKFNLNRY